MHTIGVLVQFLSFKNNTLEMLLVVYREFCLNKYSSVDDKGFPAMDLEKKISFQLGENTRLMYGAIRHCFQCQNCLLTLY